MKSTYLNENIKPILALVVVTFAFVYFFYCAISGQKPNDQILIAIVGALGTVLGYWFGSSSGSAKKDDTIADNMGSPIVNNADSVSVDAKQVKP